MGQVTTSSMNSAPRYDDDLRLAHVIADQVDGLTMEHFKSRQFEVTQKPDDTPVTSIDIAAEEVVRAQLARTRPRDAVVGEEFEPTGHGSRRWIVDPIDGTKNYLRGVPVWGTLLALVVDDEPVVGVVSAPALNRRWWAAAGAGAYTGRSLSQATRIHTSQVNDLRYASFSHSDIARWERHNKLEQVMSLARRVWRNRGYGDFWSYMLLAEGTIDIAAEPELEVYDMAALVPIVQEAGGSFTSLHGKPGPWHRSALATNGILHDQVRRLLNSTP